jgi:hypothetical protein
VCVCLGLFDASLVQLLASLVLGLPLRLLGRGDLLFDVDRRPPQDLATEARHRGVDDLGALLGDLRQERLDCFEISPRTDSVVSTSLTVHPDYFSPDNVLVVTFGDDRENDKNA